MSRDQTDAVLDKIMASPALRQRMQARMEAQGMLVLPDPGAGGAAFSQMRAALAQKGYSVLMDAMMHDLPPAADRVPTMTLGLVDVETTSRDPRQGRIIQLTVQKLLADEHGPIAFAPDGILDLYNDPGTPIPREVVNLTGITDEMVKGHRIDPAQVDAFTKGLSGGVAHNAAFDYRFLEYHMPDLEILKLPWFCTMGDVDWPARGIFNRTLGNIMRVKGYSFKEHDSLCDTRALAFVMAGEDPIPGPRSVFEEMVATAGQPSYLVIARDSPFSGNDHLKNNGFIFNDAQDSHGIRVIKTWFKPIEEATAVETAEAMRRACNGRDMTFPVIRTSLLNRFSSKKPPRAEDVVFDTADPLALYGKSVRAAAPETIELIEDEGPEQSSLGL